MGGTHDAVADYRKVLAEGVRLVVDTVTRIDAAGRGVTLASGDTVGYDYLIYAVGSGSADPGVPGAADFAHPIAGLEEARAPAVGPRAAPADGPGDGGRSRADRYRDRRRAGGAGPQGHPGLRRTCSARTCIRGAPLGGQAARRASG